MEDENKFLHPLNILKSIGIAPGMTIGDCGCGAAGNFTIPAAHIIGQNGRVYAIDVVKSALGSVESKAKSMGVDNVIPVWSNLEIYKATKIKNDTLDFAFIFSTLYQSQRRKELIKEVVRIVKKEGKIAVIDWKPESKGLGPPQEHRVNPDNIKAFLEELGLKKEKNFEPGPYHFGFVYIK